LGYGFGFAFEFGFGGGFRWGFVARGKPQNGARGGGRRGRGSGRCDRGPRAVLLFPTAWQKYAAHTLTEGEHSPQV